MTTSKTKLTITVVVFCLLLSSSISAQTIIQLPSKGSENWSWSEKEIRNNFNERIVYNVSRPSLTVYLPDSSLANGTAAVVCPGGAFHILNIDNGGEEAARWLNKKGITAFVLRYRLEHILSDDPFTELGAKRPNSPQFNQDIQPIVAMAISDGQTAINYLRTHAAEYNISPNHIGLIGFSAGGTLAAGVAYNYKAENRPDFVASIYPYVGIFKRDSIQKNAPPLFIAAASDDDFGFNMDCLELYKAWIKSGHSAELHIYAKGRHGFGMRKQSLPTDTWIDRLYDWLNQQQMIKKK